MVDFLLFIFISLLNFILNIFLIYKAGDKND